MSTQLPLQFSTASPLATRVWLSRSVKQRTYAAARTENVPRQLQSDTKWEGVTWEPALHGAKRGAVKRPTEDDEDDLEVLRLLQTRETDPSLPPRPPSPPDEDFAHDDEDASHASAARRKDKDVVPSRQTWAWDAVTQAWALVPRPRIALHGLFFAFQPVPSKHVDLLRALLNAPDSPLTGTFLREELVPRLNRDHRVSLRALDWLMVDYSCENKAVYMWRMGDGLELVDIHEKYTRLLKCWRRRRFDCFRRRHRIYFELDGKVYPTTVAQLHFFYVAARYGFLEYARVFLESIDAHMKATLVKVGSADGRKQSRKRPLDEPEAAKPMPAKPKRQALVTKAKPRAFVNAAPKQWSFRFSDMPAEDDDDDEDEDGAAVARATQA